MMKCLVTGGCGFIGSHLVEHLWLDGHKVTVLDNLSTGTKDWIITESVGGIPEVEYHFGTLQDVDCHIRKADFDVIFHLAAVSSIAASYKNIAKTHFANTNGTIAMLEFAKKCGAKFVFASTCALAGRKTSCWSPYALTKRIGEEYCRFYEQLYDLRVIMLRIHNVYGPHDDKSVISIFKEQTRKGQRLTITGDGNQRRDFIHVFDVVGAFVKASEIENTKKKGPFTVCTGKTFNLNEVADLLGGERVYIPKQPGQDYTFLETKSDLPDWGVEWEPKHKLEDWLNQV